MDESRAGLHSPARMPFGPTDRWRKRRRTRTDHVESPSGGVLHAHLKGPLRVIPTLVPPERDERRLVQSRHVDFESLITWHPHHGRRYFRQPDGKMALWPATISS